MANRPTMVDLQKLPSLAGTAFDGSGLRETAAAIVKADGVYAPGFGGGPNDPPPSETENPGGGGGGDGEDPASSPCRCSVNGWLALGAACGIALTASAVAGYLTK